MAARENKVERFLVDRIQELGGRSYKWVSPGYTGVPDRICILPPGDVLFVEVKTVEGRLSTHQLRVLTDLLEAGANVAVVNGAYGVSSMLEAWQGHTGPFRWGF